MEPQGQPIMQNSQPIAEPAKKCKHLPVIIVLAILAAGGLGFGGYELWQNMQKDDEIAKLTQQNIESEQKENDAEEKNEDPATNDAVGGPYINDNYFYVPEWGLKFRIPDELDNYGYSVDYDKAHVGYTLPMVGFTAMLKSDTLQNPQAAYYDNITTCTIVSVSKELGAWDTRHQINGTIKQFSDYALLIWNYSAHNSCDHQLHIDQVQEKIQAMFANPEKI